MYSRRRNGGSASKPGYLNRSRKFIANNKTLVKALAATAIAGGLAYAYQKDAMGVKPTNEAAEEAYQAFNIRMYLQNRSNSYRMPRDEKGKQDKNPHSILQVNPDATESVIKKAFRARAREFHPDKNHEKNTERFIELVDAKKKMLNDLMNAYEKIKE